MNFGSVSAALGVAVITWALWPWSLAVLVPLAWWLWSQRR